MANKIPVKNIKVKIKSLSGDIFLGNLNINGFERYSDFIMGNVDDYINLSGASINGQGDSFVTIFKINIGHIIPEDGK